MWWKFVDMVKHMLLCTTGFDLIDKRGLTNLKDEVKDPAIQSWICRSIFGDDYDFYTDAGQLTMPDDMKAEWDSKVAQSCVRPGRWNRTEVFNVTVKSIVKDEPDSTGVTPASGRTVGSGVTPAPSVAKDKSASCSRVSLAAPAGTTETPGTGSGVTPAPAPTAPGTGSGVTPALAPTASRPCPY